MKCPVCKENKSRVADSRDKGSWRWRRHECMCCGAKWTTAEIPAEELDTLVKIRELAKKLGEL